MTPQRADQHSLAPQVPPPIDASMAERRVWDLDGPCGSDRQFRRALFDRLPDRLASEIAGVYREVWFRDGRRAANLTLTRLRERLAAFRPQTLWHTYHDEDLRGFARRKAERNARRILAPRDPIGLYTALCADAIHVGVTPPAVGVQGVTLTGALQRLADERWWRRALRSTAGRALEAAARNAGLVHRFKQLYVSQGTLERCRGQRRRTAALLECLEAINEHGEAFTLAELADKSVSKPANRRNELMCRLAGFQVVADERGDIGEFVTITCPGRYHCRHSRDGSPVEKFNGTTPREAQSYLRTVWARIRSALKRRDLPIYGMRVAEPNHDGTPHWHLVVFVPTTRQDEFRAIVRHYALQEDGNEPGAAEHRAKFVEIDRRRGSAVSYAAKYIAKNVDGFGLDDEAGEQGPQGKAERIVNWASTWGIRQFQQIGGPPVTVWRELRRASQAPDDRLESARSAADAGDWAAFTHAMGGPVLPRRGRDINLASVWDDRLGRFGEPVGWRTVGVQSGPITLLTRVHTWDVRYRAAARTAIESGPRDPETIRGEITTQAGQDSPSWSSVNNCTLFEKQHVHSNREHQSSKPSNLLDQDMETIRCFATKTPAASYSS